MSSFTTRRASPLLLLSLLAAGGPVLAQDDALRWADKEARRLGALAAQARDRLAKAPPQAPEQETRAEDFIPATFLEDNGFVPYTHDPVPEVDQPFTIDVFRRGTPLDLKPESYLSDDNWALLPEHQRIVRSRCGPNECWQYPVGTRVVDRFFLMGAGGKVLIEFRMLTLRPDGTWSFSRYAPAADEQCPGLRPCYRLHPPSGEEVTHEETLALADGRRIQGVTLWTRFAEAECLNCHVGRSSVGYQYPRPVRRFQGPCEFGPGHPVSMGVWAERYRLRHGENPFVDAP